MNTTILLSGPIVLIGIVAISLLGAGFVAGVAAVIRILLSGGRRTGLGRALAAILLGMFAGVPATAFLFASPRHGGPISVESPTTPARQSASLIIQFKQAAWASANLDYRRSAVEGFFREVEQSLKDLAVEFESEWNDGTGVELVTRVADYATPSFRIEIRSDTRDAGAFRTAAERLAARTREIYGSTLKSEFRSPDPNPVTLEWRSANR